MSDTAARLAAYKEAELKILNAQGVRYGDRGKRMAELAEVRAAISQLESKLAAEARAARGNFGPITLVGGFNRKL